MFPVQQDQFEGWFLEGAPGSRQSLCSIEAALSRQMILRDERPGYMWLADGRGRMKMAHAIDEGIIDQAAADAIAAQEGCHYSQPYLTVELARCTPRRRGTLDMFEGTPAGAIAQALQMWIRNPHSVDEGFKLATALDAALKQVTADA